MMTKPDAPVSALASGASGRKRDLPEIRILTQAGWVDAVRRFVADRDDSLEVLDSLVAGYHQVWRGFLDVQSTSRVLLLGSGYGSFIECLAPHCGHLVVVEPDIEKLQFVLQRLAIFAVDDAVLPIVSVAEGNLPFADAAFDAVVVVEPDICGKPVSLLNEIGRVLADGGQVLLVADNRFSLALPTGWWDGWTSPRRPLGGVIRGSVMLARWWQTSDGAQSLPALHRQLSVSGFSVSDEFGLWPTRYKIEELVPHGRRRHPTMAGETGSWRQKLKRHRLFLPAHAVIAQKGGKRRRSTYERIFEAAAEQVSGGGKITALRASRYIITRKEKLVILARRGKDELVLRIPVGPAAEQAERRHIEAITHLPASLFDIAPEPLASGRVDGMHYHVERALPGPPLKKLLHQVAAPKLFEQAMALLERVNPTSSLHCVELSGMHYDRLVLARLDRLFQVLPEQALRSRLSSFLKDQLHGAKLPLGLVHGDFTMSNIHISDGRAGIIDWEAADVHDLPILDAITFLESWLRPYGRRYSLAERVRGFAQCNFPTTEEERFLSSCYERLKIDRAYHAGLVYLSWLRHIDFLLPYWLRYHPGEQRRYIHDVVDLMPTSQERL